MNEKQKELINRIYDELDIDLSYEIENNMPDDIDAFMDIMQERVNEIEVIYYSNAMEYLTENDTSLQYSLEIAKNMGYTIENINSELLATLLKQQEASEHIYDYKDEIEKLFFNEVK